MSDILMKHHGHRIKQPATMDLLVHYKACADRHRRIAIAWSRLSGIDDRSCSGLRRYDNGRIPYEVLFDTAVALLYINGILQIS